MSFTKLLSKKLQGRTEDILSAYKCVDLVKTVLKATREDIENVFHTWFSEVTALSEKVGSTPTMPRTCSRQTHRDNVEAETLEEYYRRVLVIPYLDGLINGIGHRFCDLTVTAAMPLKLLPSNVQTTTVTDLEKFIEQYSRDLPSPCAISSELTLWKAHCENLLSDPDILLDTAARAIKVCKESDFPNIHMMLKIVCTLGVTSCECERANSELGLLKSYLRTTMRQDRLTGLALMHVHHRVTRSPAFIARVIDIFSRKHPRRMLLRNVLDK